MAEEQPTNKCPHCGYLADSGEHASDCPNASGKQEAAEKDSPSNSDVADSGGTVVELESDSVDKKEQQTKARSKLRSMVNKMKTWGLAAATLVILVHGTDRLANLKVSQEPESTDSSLTLKRSPKTIKNQPITDPAEAAHVRAIYKEKLGQYEQTIESALEKNAEEIRYLEEQYGEDMIAGFLGDIQKKERIKIVPSRNEIGPDTTVAVGFEEMEIDSDRFLEICQKTYPKGWITTEIDSVIMHEPEPDSVDVKPNKYNLGEGWNTVGRARLKELGITSVDLYPSYSLRDVLDVFSHELGHVNDWDHDNSLSAADKIALFSKVTKRFLEGDNLFHSDYVESINNPDPQHNLELKVAEYWAEICAEYFGNPNKFSEQHPEDFGLVDSWVHQQDPDFEPFEQSLQRNVYADNLQDLQEEYRELEFQERRDALPEAVQNKIHSLLNTFAQELVLELVHQGSTSIDRRDLKIENKLEEIFTEAGIDEDAKDFSQKLWRELVQLEDKNRTQWEQEAYDEFEQSLTNDTREGITRFVDRFREVLSTAEDNFDYGAFHEEFEKDLQKFCDSNNLEETPSFIIDWFWKKL